MCLSKTTLKKYHQLQQIITSYSKVIVSYSGGTDSSFLLKVAIDCLGRHNVLACIALSASMPEAQYKTACETAKKIDAQLETIHTQEISDPAYIANTPDRCFHCKSHICSLISELASQRQYDAIFSGSNADDLTDFRPGRKAEEKYHIVTPLQQAHLTKDDIRKLSKKLHLSTWNTPAQPCLASRIAYGTKITEQKLKQIEQAEQFLADMDLGEIRLRHHGHIARIEVPPGKIHHLTKSDTRKKIVQFLKELGFTYITLDLEGFRSGSANEALCPPTQHRAHT